MFKSLVLMCDSISHGKQILYVMPQYISNPKFLDLFSLPPQHRRNPVQELLTQFIQLYDYFGDYNKKDVCAGYGWDIFINCFSGSQKYQELCLTVNKHIFISKTVKFKKQQGTKNDLTLLSLVAVLDSVEFLDSAKYLLGFLAQLLEKEQWDNKLISNQMHLYDVRHANFAQQVKSLIIKYRRQTQLDYWFQVQAPILEQIRQFARKETNDILVIRLLKNFWYAVKGAKQFHYLNYHTHTSLLLSGDRPPQLGTSFLHKSLLFSKTQIKEQLGSFYTKQRAEMVEHNIQSTKSFGQVIKEFSLQEKDLENILSILISNQLAVVINPVRKNSKYISCMRWKLTPEIRKDFEILFHQPLIPVLKSFQSQRSIGNNVHFNELRFLLLNGLVKDLDIYVFDKECPQPLQSPDKQLYDLLKTYSYTGVSIDQIAHTHSDQTDLFRIKGFLNNNHAHLGFYQVEAD